KEHFDTELREDRLDKVILPHRNAAGHEQKIMLEAIPDFVAKIVEIVAADTEDDRLCACFFDLSANGVGIAVSNLAGLRLLIDFNQLIAGRNNCDPRLL